MIRQILLSLPTYPDCPPLQTLEGAVTLAQLLEASLTAQIPQLSSDSATWPKIMGAFPLDFPRLMNETVITSEKNAGIITKSLTELCCDRGVPLEIRRSLATLYPSPDFLVDLARLHDLLVLPVPEMDCFDRSFIEAALFDTGRPTLLLPSGEGTRSLSRLDTVVVAWDFSREAARALGDALPILTRAKQVHVLSILGEKGLHTTSTFGDLEKWFAAHKVNHVAEQRTAEDGAVSETVIAYTKEVDADLLIMGAYGHSRFREFILGGATRGILSGQSLPVLVSH
jgi:nucleotide-binding universal stress UspA family protein